MHAVVSVEDECRRVVVTLDLAPLGDGDKSDVLIFTSYLLVKKLAIKLHLSGGGLSCIEMQGGV